VIRSVLLVAFPFGEVGPDAVGGAEQALATLEAGLFEAGVRTTVLACAGSIVRGRLRAGPRPPPSIDESARMAAWAAWRDEVATLGRRVDLVHLHGLDFSRYLPAVEVPTVVTLHLPLAWYDPDPLRLRRPGLRLVCVSESQRAAGEAPWAEATVVPNGVSIGEPPPLTRRSFALALSRICPEKGLHDAVLAARAADVPLVIGGRVFPYPAHQAYFRDRLAPLLDSRRRFLGPLGGARKRRLLTAARCLLVPSTAPETSSLVAMEALAAGTPVVARRVGALPEIVEHGRTGFVVDDVPEMADAIRRCSEIDPGACRTAARERFAAPRMVRRYLELYRSLIAGR
jgi:glycosyltransferase involved in cell wall biosynthesis